MMLAGKTVLVTGASAGIGADAMRLFAAEGAIVSNCARHKQQGKQIVASILKQGQKATFIATDLTEELQIDELFVQVRADYPDLYGTFNNASIEQAESTLNSTDSETFDRVMNLNVRSLGPYMRHELQIMQANGCGSIVNTGSIAGAGCGRPGHSRELHQPGKYTHGNV